MWMPTNSIKRLNFYWIKIFLIIYKNNYFVKHYSLVIILLGTENEMDISLKNKKNEINISLKDKRKICASYDRKGELIEQLEFIDITVMTFIKIY